MSSNVHTFPNLAAPPELVPSDMENGLESGSVVIAKEFWKRFGVEASKYTTRRALGRFFAAHQNELFTNPLVFAAGGGGGSWVRGSGSNYIDVMASIHQGLGATWESRVATIIQQEVDDIETNGGVVTRPPPKGYEEAINQLVGTWGPTVANLIVKCTKNGRTDPRRHFRQVLYALRLEGKVLQVFNGGTEIHWLMVPQRGEWGEEEKVRGNRMITVPLDLLRSIYEEDDRRRVNGLLKPYIQWADAQPDTGGAADWPVSVNDCGGKYDVVEGTKLSDE